MRDYITLCRDVKEFTNNTFVYSPPVIISYTQLLFLTVISETKSTMICYQNYEIKRKKLRTGSE